MRDLSNYNMLFVEDNPMNQTVAKTIFTGWGMHIDFAENGKVAVQMAKEKKYDIILMDIYMPEMNGYQATQLIREQYSKEQLPIIAITAAPEWGSEMTLAMEAGMNDHIFKPFNHEELNEKIYRLLHPSENKA